MPDLGRCCMCEGRRRPRNIVMLDRRGAVPGHGWDCAVCGLPADGAYAVLCDPCLRRWQADGTLLKVACRGYPAEGGRVWIKDLPPGEFGRDMSRHQDDA